MEITLTHKVDELRKVYVAELRTKENGKIIGFSILILAMSAEEAIAKLKEYTFQEYPPLAWDKVEYRVRSELVVT